MTVAQIVAHVRSAIDELTVNGSAFVSQTTDDANLDSIIKDKIAYALTYVIENAPEEKLDGDLLDTLTGAEMTDVTIAAGDPVKVEIPTNVIRVVSARLSSWSQSPVPVKEGSQEYLMQQDAYAKGSWDRPVTAIAYKNNKRYLELYSAKTNGDNVYVSLVRKPTIGDTTDPQTTVGVPVRLEAAFIYQIAGLTMVAFREDVAASLFTIARQHLTGISQ